ncbi:PTO-like protein kinase isoform X1 [Panicum miliaceum]|uniref:PTO-like protein kinase isoform X1 n=1 Tax=Panicum miliaceum TaxID=4540 RepID=A0A3L6R1N8_PANMI|nr:PTO-like protein kinase isoform X1 [Panicum miliaceum]
MFGNIELKCLAEERTERPTMEEVLKDLEWELKCVRATASTSSSTEPAAEDESDHAVSSQPIIWQGQGRALKRSEGKIYKRTPGFVQLETIIE